MPYKSKAERERERWMTLAEAIDWISKQERCSRSEATRQIRAALADNALGPRRWEDQHEPRHNPDAISSPDFPPMDHQFWKEADIRVNTGQIFDPGAKRWRVLLISKHSIFHLWLKSSVASAGSESRKAATIPKAKGRGRPSAEIIHQALDQLLQREVNLIAMNRKELVALVNEECSKQTGENREYALSTVQKYLRSWLEKRRTEAGRRQKNRF